MFLICVFDGLRPDMVRPDWTPNLWRMRQEGVWFSRSHCVFPSVTRVNAASLITGCFPGKHGIEGNAIWRPEVDAAAPLNTGSHEALRRLHPAGGKLLLAPTIGEVLAAQGRATVAAGTGTSGCGYLQHPEAATCGGLVYHHDFSTPLGLAGEIEGVLGPGPSRELDYPELAVARVEYAARVLTEVLIPRARPALALFWITVPDGLHHRFGLGAPESVAAIRAADAAFGRMLERLGEQGLGEDLDVVVTADHGYATVSGHVDVAGELERAGLARGDSRDVVCCMVGGSCPIYVRPGVDLEAIARFLVSQRWVDGLFARDASVPGALPLSLLGCDGPHAPDLLAAMAWDGGANGHGVEGTSIGPPSAPLGVGDHGGISPFEMRNLLLASGPHFRQRATSDAPCGITDIAPTVLHCLGIETQAEWQGRVLLEGLRESGKPPRAWGEERVAAFRGGRQVLSLAQAGGVTYAGGAKSYRG